MFEILYTSIEAAGYQLGRTLGEGRFSQVVLGTCMATSIEYAIKVVDQSSLDQDEEAGEALRVEVDALARAARHAHVVALRDVVQTPAATYLVMDLMAGGELFDAIVARGCFSEADARRHERGGLRALPANLGCCHSDS